MSHASEYSGLGLRMPPVYFVGAVLAQVLVHFLLPVMQLWVSPLRWLSLLLVVAAVILAVISARSFRRAGTTLRPGGGDSTALVMAGPFRYSRNPMYLALSLILLGLAVMLGSLGPLIVVPVFMALIQRDFILAEEHALAQRFGADYQDYCRRVRRWL